VSGEEGITAAAFFISQGRSNWLKNEPMVKLTVMVGKTLITHGKLST
jgi:hypothetical protein